MLAYLQRDELNLQIYITMQQPLLPFFPAASANGSSSLLRGPHIEGRSGSFVLLQYSARLLIIHQKQFNLIYSILFYLADASETGMRGNSNCSRKRSLCSNILFSFASDMLQDFFVLDGGVQEFGIINNSYERKEIKEKKIRAGNLNFFVFAFLVFLFIPNWVRVILF